VYLPSRAFSWDRRSEKWQQEYPVQTLIARRKRLGVLSKSTIKKPHEYFDHAGFRHGQLVVVINGGARTCETYAALSVTVMLTRFPTLESILTSRSMVNL